MLRKKEEIIDVGLATLAPSVGEQRIGVLQLLGTKPVDRNGPPLLQKEAPIGPVLEEFEDRSGRLVPVPVLCLNQEYRLAVFQKVNRAVQDVQFVSFDVDFHKGDVLMHDCIEAYGRHVDRKNPLVRR